VSSLSKQAGSQNGSFYVLQNPNTSVASYHIGELLWQGNSSYTRLGFFTTYDQSAEESLGPVEAVFTLDGLKAYLSSHKSTDFELRLNPTLSGKKGYKQTFEKIQKKMKQGGLKKAVLFQSVEFQGANFLSKADFLELIDQVLSAKTSGYLYGFYNPKTKRALLGLTPEFLCRECEGLKYTTAVAGTKTADDQVQDWSSKLKEEHSLVKKGIETAFDVMWSENKIQEYGQLRHLKSEGVLKTEVSVGEVSLLLHPTSAVGTLPREMSQKVCLGDLSNKRRGHFGGYALLEGIDEPFSLVTIRGLEWSNKRSFVCIGGGVTAQSQFEEEWNELEKKWETFRSLWSK